ncbi:hypothetical protein PT974_05643 [Cladobotryum mycophilum]|uniref:Uncharacterized protein n=1 Tax=Cladobotryum mycophilum TaxID=491253 RepID=A0ABR0SJD7_9HYPO
MSAVVDKALYQACMADLSRERQEELPLSDVSKRGPTFQPGRGTGVSHIPKELKAKLSKGWGAKIDDEESKQMEGLEYEDARPWAKQIARDYMRSHVFQTAPPQLASGFNRNSTKGPAGIQKPKAPQKGVNDPGARQRQASILAGAQKKAFAVQQSQQQPMKSLSTERAQVMTTQKGLPNTSPTSNDQPKSETTPPPTGETQDHTLYKGPCEIVTGVNGKNTFAAEYVLRANLKTSHGFLVLTAPGKGGERVHNVLDLDPPTVQGAVCMVTCQQGKGTFKYSLRFKPDSKADHFRHYLKSLQDSATQHLKTTSMAIAAVSSVSSSIAKETETSEEKKKIVLPLTREDYSNPAEETSIEPATGTAIVTTSNNSSEIPTSGETERSLVHIDDAPPSNGLVHVTAPGASMYDAANSLLIIVQKILFRIAEGGAQISAQTVRDVGDAVVQDWNEAGFMHGEDEGMRADFQELLHILIRIKIKTDERKGEQMVSQIPAIEALKRDPVPEKREERITYTPEEIRSLEWKAMPHQEDIEDSRTITQRHKANSVAQSISHKKAVITALSRHKDWLAGKPSSHEPASNDSISESRQDGSSMHSDTTQVQPTVTLPASVPQITNHDFTESCEDGNSLHANNVESPARLNVVLPSPTPKAKPQVQGLASSRWASPSNYTVSAAKSTEALQSKWTPRVVEVPQVAQVPKANPASRSAAQGLSASRWADKPAAFEGQFAGI